MLGYGSLQLGYGRVFPTFQLVPSSFHAFLPSLFASLPSFSVYLSHVESRLDSERLVRNDRYDQNIDPPSSDQTRVQKFGPTQTTVTLANMTPGFQSTFRCKSPGARLPAKTLVFETRKPQQEGRTRDPSTPSTPLLTIAGWRCISHPQPESPSSHPVFVVPGPLPSERE